MSLLPLLALPAVLFVTQPVQPPAEPAAPALAAPAAVTVIDPKAEALLTANAKAMFALKSYAATCDTVLIYAPTEKRPKEMRNYELATLTAVKPNLMRYDGWELSGPSPTPTASPTYTFANDGKRSFKQFGDTYREDKRIEAKYQSTILEPWSGFYSQESALLSTIDYVKKNNQNQEWRYAGKEAVDGVSCDVVSFKYAVKYNDTIQSYEGKLFFGPDKLVRRKIESLTFDGKNGYTRDATLRNIRTNFATPPAATFAYTPAAGVKAAAEREAARPKLLTAGTVAPDFTVEDINGKPVKLSDFRGKTVILDFWATWCGPCMMAMPSTNAAGKKYKDSNVVVVAVNVWDEKDKYRAWVPKNQDKYGDILFLLDPNGSKDDVAKKLYNVSGIPTQYIIDKNGVVRTALVGYDDDPKVLESAVEAAQKPMPSPKTASVK